MDNSYNRHNRRKYSLKVDIVFLEYIVVFFLNSIGRNIYFGLTGILLIVFERYRQLLYKNT